MCSRLKRDRTKREEADQTDSSELWTAHLLSLHCECRVIALLVCLCVKYHRRKHTGTMTHFWLLTHQMWMCHQEQKHAPCCCLWASAWWCSDAMIGEWWPLWTYNLFSDGVDSSPYVTLGLAILAPTSFSGHKIIGKSAASLCNVANGHLF